jgi:NADPH:quinone reductase-like Zn-dependent oxidoreductase
MKATVQKAYGSPQDVLELKEIDKPIAGEYEVLVRVHFASVHPDIWHVVTGQPYVLRLMGSGIFKPKYQIPGTDMAGVVESVGKSVTQFKIGDEVFGETLKGMQWLNGGAFAEYVAVSEDVLAVKPKAISFEQAASVATSGLIVLGNLQNQRKIKPGQQVLINGAGGGVGSIALQFAKAMGAQVTAVDTTRKLDMLAGLGADHVIDYTQQDFTSLGLKYDLIFDVASNLTFSACKKVLKPEGKYVLIGHDQYGSAAGRIFGSIPRMLKLIVLASTESSLRGVTFSPLNKKEAMVVLKQLLETGKLTPVIDRVFPLSEAAQALKYLASGLACGRILIRP